MAAGCPHREEAQCSRLCGSCLPSPPRHLPPPHHSASPRSACVHHRRAVSQHGRRQLRPSYLCCGEWVGCGWHASIWDYMGALLRLGRASAAKALCKIKVPRRTLSSFLQTLMFFAGFLIRFSQIPKYWQWYGYIDVLR